MSSFSITKNKSNLNKFARTRITRACDQCQKRRTKCDSAKPRCSKCVRHGDYSCTFNANVKKRGPKPKQCINYYLNYKDEKQSQKFTSAYPYMSYFPLSTKPINLNNNTNVETNFHRVICHQQSLDSANISPILNCSEFPTSTTNFNISQKLPFITRGSSNFSSSSTSLQKSYDSTSPGNIPSNRNFKYPRLVSTLSLPPIEILLSIKDTSQYRRDLTKPVVSSPSYYKLNTIG